MTNTSPHITFKQQEILELIYRYRFLNRKHIQALLNHKDKRRVISWLKDLREKKYVNWKYNATHFITKGQPAIYYLSLNGIRYIRSLSTSQIDELRKRYKDSSRTQMFIDRNLLIADCCVAIIAESNDKIQYSFSLPTDYAKSNDPHNHLKELKPHLFLSMRQSNNATQYLLENFEQSLPQYQLRERLKKYVSYLNDNSGSSLLVALFICANTPNLLYVKRNVKKLLENNERVLHIRVTTLDKVKTDGVTGTIWEEV